MTWRGQSLPISSRTVSFSHDNVQHKFTYRNGNIIETTGAQSWTFSYTIPMRENLRIGPFEALFSQGLTRLVRNMRDKRPGILIDPVYGQFQCAPGSFADNIDVNLRDGTDIEIQLMHSPDIDDVSEELKNTPDVRQIESEARTLDEQVQVSGVVGLNNKPPEPTTDIFSAIAGVGRQIELRGNQTLNALERYIFEVEQIENAVDRLEDPSTFSLKRRSRRARDTAHRAKDRLQNPFRRIKTVTFDYAQTISSIAADAGMTVKEFLDLNPLLAALPEIPPNKPVNLFVPEQP